MNRSLTYIFFSAHARFNGIPANNETMAVALNKRWYRERARSKLSFPYTGPERVKNSVDKKQAQTVFVGR